MSAPRRITALTGVRIFAALVVLVEHFDLFLGGLVPEIAGALSVFSLGHLGVSVFFVLSGLILYYSYAEKLQTLDAQAYGTFVWRRIARILPLQWLVLGLCGAAALLSGPLGLDLVPAAPLAELPGQLLLLNDWMPRDTVASLNWNPPSWSLSAEWFAYLLCPVLFWAMVRRPDRLTVTALGAAGIAMVVGVLPAISFSSGPIAIVGWFMLGTALGAVLSRGWIEPGSRNDGIALLLIAAGGLLVLWAPTLAINNLGIAILASSLLFIGLSEGRLASLLSSPRIVYWGEASYSLYMTHFIVLAVLATPLLSEGVLASGPMVRFALGLGAVAIVAVVAAAAHRWVERPAERALRARLRQRLDGEGKPGSTPSGSIPTTGPIPQMGMSPITPGTLPATPAVIGSVEPE